MSEKLLSNGRSVNLGTVEIIHGKDGRETSRSVLPCFDAGDFAVHQTVGSKFWTCSHKQTGLAVATHIESVWKAIECAEETAAAATCVGLDATSDTYEKLRAQPAWLAFAKRCGEIRVKYNDSAFLWPEENPPAVAEVD